MKHIMVIVCLAILLVIAGMPIATASPTISGISPSSGPNNMDVQIIVHGTGFNTSTSTVWLKMCPNEKNAVGEHPLYPSSYSVDSSTQITATFPLSGRDVGWYDVHVEQPGSAKDMNLPIVAYIYPIAFQVYGHRQRTIIFNHGYPGNDRNNRPDLFNTKQRRQQRLFRDGSCRCRDLAGRRRCGHEHIYLSHRPGRDLRCGREDGRV